MHRYPDMPTAADVVNALDQQALASILRGYGEEKHAKKIASAIVQARSVYPITRTQQLASIVAGILINSEQYLREGGKKLLTWIYTYIPNSQRDSFVLEIMQDRILPIILLCHFPFLLQASPPTSLLHTQLKKKKYYSLL